MYNKKILLVVIFSIIVYAFLGLFADFSELVTSFRRFHWGWFFVALALALLNYMVRFYRWEYYLDKLAIVVRRYESFVIFFMGLIMSITPGKVGEVLKSMLLKEANGTAINKSVPIVFMERFTDFMSVLLLAVIGVVTFNYGIKVLIVPVLISVCIFLLLSIEGLVYGIISLVGKINRLKKPAEWVKTAYQHAIVLMNFRSLTWATLLGMIAWFAECAAFYVVLKGFGVDVSLMHSTFIYALATLAGAVSMLPGGIGTTEGSMVILLLMGGVPKDIAVAATLIIRVCTLWFAVLLGVLTMLSRPLCRKVLIYKEPEG